MIKNFDTYINEDYFSKLASRKDNGEVRKESYARTNLKDIAAIDVYARSGRLWASTTLEVDDKRCFSVDEMNEIMKLPEIKKSGWRLPRKDEFFEDFRNITSTLSDESDEYKCFSFTILTPRDSSGNQEISDIINIPCDDGYDNLSVFWTCDEVESSQGEQQYAVLINDSEYNKQKVFFYKTETGQILLVRDK